METHGEEETLPARNDMAMFTVGSATSSLITVELTLDNKRMPMEVDTGAAVSIMSADTLSAHFSDNHLTPSFGGSENVHRGAHESVRRTECPRAV